MAFEYTPYRNPYIGTIADLMARGEDAKAKALIDVASAQARAAEAKGQIYGNAISSIGQQIGNIPAQMQANKEQAFKADQQARMVRGQQQEDAAKAMFNQIMGSKNMLGVTRGPLSAPVVTPATTTAGTDMESENIPDTPETQTLPSRAFMPTVTKPFKELSVRGVDGLDKWDVEKASQQFASLGLGVEGQKYLELMRGSNDDMDKHHASAMDLVKKSAARALQAGSFDMMLGSTNALMDQLANNKVIGREDLSAFQQQIDGLNALPQNQKETALRGLLRNISGQDRRISNLSPGESAVDLDTGEVLSTNVKPSPVTMVGNPFARVNPKTGKPELMQRFSDGTMQFAGNPVPPTQPAGPRPTYVTLSSPSGEQRQMENGPQANTLLSQGWKILQSGQAGDASTQAKGISLLEGSLANLRKIDKGLTQQSGITGAISGRIQKGLGAMSLDVLPSVYDGLSAAIPITLAKAAGEVGNLALQEQKVWEPLSPKSSDGFAIRQAKYAAIDAFVAAVRKGPSRDGNGKIVPPAVLADDLLQTLTNLNNGVVPITTPTAKAAFDDAGRNTEADALIARARAAGKGGQ